MEHGLSASTPVAIIEKGTTHEQRVVTGRLDELESLAQREAVQAPAIIVVGEVVKLRKDCNWQASSSLEQVA